MPTTPTVSSKPVYPLPNAAFPEPGVYIVQRVDTKVLIAKNLCLMPKQLSILNPTIDWSRLKSGQRLRYAPPPNK